MPDKNPAPRLDKTIISVVPLSEADDDKEYWKSKTPEERMQALEYYRRLVYGEAACSARLLRVLEVVERKKR